MFDCRKYNIYLWGNPRLDWETTYPFGHINNPIFDKFKKTPATKGDVWIGQNTTIMSGVTIGYGSVIAINSHV